MNNWAPKSETVGHLLYVCVPRFCSDVLTMHTVECRAPDPGRIRGGARIRAPEHVPGPGRRPGTHSEPFRGPEQGVSGPRALNICPEPASGARNEARIRGPGHWHLFLYIVRLYEGSCGLGLGWVWPCLGADVSQVG